MKYERTPFALSINRKRLLRMTAPKSDITKKSTSSILLFLYHRHEAAIWQAVAGSLVTVVFIAWVF